MNNLSVRLVFDRKHKATKKHQASIQLEVTFNGQRKFIASGIKLYSDQWGKDMKIKNHPQSILLNQQLSDMVGGIYEFAHKLQKDEVPFTFERLNRHLKGNANENSFLDFMKHQIEIRQIKKETKQHHWCIYNALVDFGKIVCFGDLNYTNIMKWDKYAHTRCSKQTSAYNYHKVLKIYVKEALLSQLIKVNPYDGIKISRGTSTGRKYLTKEELEKVEQTQIDNLSLARVRDMFVFCCYTGLAYSDLAKFDFNKAEETNGMYRIRDVRKKTNTEYNISLLDKAMAILRQYSFSLPIISNQKYNSYLKVLGAFCGVKKSLTSHVARHTFATTVTMANGVRIEVISKMLGHTNIQTTQIYAKICQSEVDNEFNRLNKIV